MIYRDGHTPLRCLCLVCVLYVFVCRCDPGFDGGHPPVYLLEVSLFTGSVVSSHEPDTSVTGSLKPGGKQLVYNLSRYGHYLVRK